MQKEKLKAASSPPVKPDAKAVKGTTKRRAAAGSAHGCTIELRQHSVACSHCKMQEASFTDSGPAVASCSQASNLCS